MWEIIGGVAAGLAVIQGISFALAFLRRRHIRNRLQATLARFITLDRRLTALVAEITWRLRDGVGWEGWAIWPEPLAAHLTHLRGLINWLERGMATTRALDADASLERLRIDVEELGDLLREVAETYFRGTISAYQMSDGKPIGFSATGRAPIAPLSNENGDQLVEKRRRIRLLFRSTTYRWEREWGELKTAEWAIVEWELPDEHDQLLQDELFEGEQPPPL